MTGSRKSRNVLLIEAIAEFNKHEENKSLRVITDELAAIRFLANMDEPFLQELKVIWGTERPQHTAIPMNLLGEKWLQPEEMSSVPVPQLCHIHVSDCLAVQRFFSCQCQN
jgi:hypothetical protein